MGTVNILIIPYLRTALTFPIFRNGKSLSGPSNPGIIPDSSFSQTPCEFIRKTYLLYFQSIS